MITKKYKNMSDRFQMTIYPISDLFEISFEMLFDAICIILYLFDSICIILYLYVSICSG